MKELLEMRSHPLFRAIFINDNAVEVGCDKQIHTDSEWEHDDHHNYQIVVYRRDATTDRNLRRSLNILRRKEGYGCNTYHTSTDTFYQLYEVEHSR